MNAVAAPETRIDWNGVPHSPVLEAQIGKEAARLAAAHPGVNVRRVSLESMDPQGSLIGPVCVNLEARAPERQLIVNRAHDDPVVAVREGFAVLFHAFERRHGPDRRVHEARAA